jgi:hypothetical protein
MAVAIDPAARARRVWSKIQRKPSSVAFTRQAALTDAAPPTGPTTLPAQVVRVVRDNRPRELRGETGQGVQNHCVVYGVRDHPDVAVVDTDIERGDRFVLDGDHYEVDYVKLVPGGLQAIAVLQGIGT